MTADRSRPPARSSARWIGRLFGTLGFVFGSALVALAAVLGDCAAFGGTCPADPASLLDDDVFRFAAIGGAIAIGVPVFANHPTRRRLIQALAAASATALVVGLLVRSIAHG